MEVSQASDREIQFNLVKIFASDAFTIKKSPLNHFVVSSDRYMQFITSEAKKLMLESGHRFGKTKFIGKQKKMNFIDAGKSLVEHLNDITSGDIPAQYENFNNIWKLVKEEILPQIIALINQKSDIDDFQVEVTKKKGKLKFTEIDIDSIEEKKMKNDVKAFEEAMKSSDPVVRKKAIAKFSDLTEFSISRGHLQFKVTLPKLFSKYKKESDDENRLEIIRALGRTTYNYPIDLDQKILLPRPGQTMQTYKKIMPEYKKAALKCLPILLEAIDDSSDQVRYLAIMTLGSLGPLAKDALPKLNEYWKSSNDQEALEAINNISKGKVDDIYSSALEIIRQKKTDSYSQALNILMKLEKEKIKEIESQLEPIIIEDKKKRGNHLAFGLSKVLAKIENDNAVEYLVSYLLDLPREWIWYPNLVLIYPPSIKLIIRLHEEAEKTDDKVKIANLDEVLGQMKIENIPKEDFVKIALGLKEKGIDMEAIQKKFEKNPIREVAHRFHQYRDFM
jgi:hypothetical protein